MKSRLAWLQCLCQVEDTLQAVQDCVLHHMSTLWIQRDGKLLENRCLITGFLPNPITCEMVMLFLISSGMRQIK